MNTLDYLAEVLGSHTIIVPAWKLMYKGQHLVFGADEFRLGGAAMQQAGINARKGGRALFSLFPKFLIFFAWCLSWV